MPAGQKRHDSDVLHQAAIIMKRRGFDETICRVLANEAALLLTEYRKEQSPPRFHS